MSNDFTIKNSLMLPPPREFWDLPNFIKLFIGGYGSGKTYIGALRSIYLSYINRPLPHLYISPTYKQARKTVIITITKMLDKSNLTYTYNKTEHTFYIHNWEGTIWIASGDEPSSLKGPNLASIGIDEPFIQQKEVMDIALARLREPMQKHYELFLTGTPEQFNWGYDLFKNNEQILDLGIVRASTRENTYLPDYFVPMLERAYDDNQRAAFIEGQFVNLTSGRVYKYFTGKEENAATPNREPCGHTEICAGVDFNVDALSAEIFMLYSDRVEFFDEIRLRDATTYDLADKLAEKYPGIRLFPDPSGRARKTSSDATDFMILRDRGFQVEARNQQAPVRSRVNAVNNMLREGRLRVRNCPYLVKDFEQVTWKNGDINKTDLKLTHASDAAGYAIEKLFPVKMPDRNFVQPIHWRV